MVRDTMQAHIDAKDAALDAELERFAQHVIGRNLFEGDDAMGWSSSVMRGRGRR